MYVFKIGDAFVYLYVSELLKFELKPFYWFLHECYLSSKLHEISFITKIKWENDFKKKNQFNSKTNYLGKTLLRIVNQTLHRIYFIVWVLLLTNFPIFNFFSPSVCSNHQQQKNTQTENDADIHCYGSNLFEFQH